MTYMKVRGFKVFKDRLGKWRCYHRATGLPIDLAKFPPGSTEFTAECARIEALRGRGIEAKPGTLGLLIERYRGHRAFLDLAPRTRADYHRCLDYLKPLHETPLARFSAPTVVKIRDKAADQLGRRWGNYVKTVLSVIFAWGHERGFVTSNPAFRIKSTPRPRNAPDANRPWTDAERHAVVEVLPAHMALPVALMMYCALDPQDALRLPKTAISDGRINTRRGKTAAPVWLPLPEPVAKAVAAAPAHDAMTLCANSWGRPWTVSGFRASWRPVRLKLLTDGKIEPGLTLKGLRHTVATILAEMNYDDRTIADYLGQRTEAMARHYSKRANRTRKLAAVVKKFDREANRRRTKIVKPGG